MTLAAGSSASAVSVATKVVVIGAGGHGRELLDVLDACNSDPSTPCFDVAGVLDDNPTEANLGRLRARGVKFLGCIDDWLEGPRSETRYLIGVGTSAARRSIDCRMTAGGVDAAIAIHPSVIRGSSVRFAPGVVALAGAVLATNISLGRHTHLHRCATIGHDCVVGDFVTINPSASISGDCVIEDDVMIGVGASVLQGLTVHSEATVGGMACVVRDVPPAATVKGVPAK